jgi:hypothetical protein
MTHDRARDQHDRGRPGTRDTARPTPHKGVTRIAEPRGTPEPATRGALPVKPRGGPPRPRGVR